MTQPLSPAAQAVKDAVLALYSDEKVHEFGWQLDAPTVASALRAVADQVVPEKPCPDSDCFLVDALVEREWEQQQALHAQILAIAAELEGGR